MKTESPEKAYKRITGIKYTGTVFQQIWCRGYSAAMSQANPK